MDSLTTNTKDFDDDPIVSHKSTIFRLSKGNSICISVINDELLQIQKYYEEFILRFKNHTQNAESGIQDISTRLTTGGSEEDDSTLISFHSIIITPINCEILKQFELRKR